MNKMTKRMKVMAMTAVIASAAFSMAAVPVSVSAKEQQNIFFQSGFTFSGGNGIIIVKPGICNPTPGLPDVDNPMPDLPDTDNPNPDKPDTDNPTPDKPDTDNPTPDKPDTDKPTPDKPDTDNPAPDMPDTDKPTPDIPDTDKPDDDNTGGDTSKPEQPDDGEEELTLAEQVVILVNKERQKAGLRPLQLHQSIEDAAMIRAIEIRTAFSHSRPDGTSFTTALKEQGVNYRGAGENIAWGQRTPKQVMDAWMNSEGHRANIMNEKFTHIGVGHFQDASGTSYWTQLFMY